MSAALASASARRNRWAISFADLLLLILGFFVMLQASGSRRDAMLAQVSRQFGGRPMAQGEEWRAADLFAPGEALLTPAGRATLSALAQRLRRETGAIDLRSSGVDAAHQRFDAWDLAAARLGAVARALRADGIAQDRLRIRGLDQADASSGKGQRIRIAPAAH
ncbi:MAG: flagellar motor protein [Sphingobium sp.]|uniref:OmpA/MotB family protein n=1 Tax=Sphingobium sp. TaxID=1912891 RepID=UPI000DB38816|nr:flagellar motor protein MotB [Sphingobium sp.]PZU13268.1 MAG: flagellar motor protein [Sphingobium sp.]